MTKRSTARRLAAAGAAGLMTLAGASVLATPASAHEQGQRSELNAELRELNDSGVHGTARADVHDNRVDVQISARHLAPGLPHAQHIHFGTQAEHECPTLANRDDDGNGKLSTGEGLPDYGPIAVSLTTTGGTSFRSGLALDRMPVADADGRVAYQRDDLKISRNDDDSKRAIRRGIARGEGVVVLHGVDFNGNGTYDFDGAGPSDLNPAAPEEATAPAACGVLQRR